LKRKDVNFFTITGGIQRILTLRVELNHTGFEPYQAYKRVGKSGQVLREKAEGRREKAEGRREKGEVGGIYTNHGTMTVTKM